MSKKKTEKVSSDSVADTQQPKNGVSSDSVAVTQQPKNGAAGDSIASVPAFVDELLKNGTIILTSLNREDFGPMLKKIPADVKYSVGAVGFNPEVSEYSLRVDIIKL